MGIVRRLDWVWDEVEVVDDTNWIGVDWGLRDFRDWLGVTREDWDGTERRKAEGSLVGRLNWCLRGVVGRLNWRLRGVVGRLNWRLRRVELVGERSWRRFEGAAMYFVSAGPVGCSEWQLPADGAKSMAGWKSVSHAAGPSGPCTH